MVIHSQVSFDSNSIISETETDKTSQSGAMRVLVKSGASGGQVRLDSAKGVGTESYMSRGWGWGGVLSLRESVEVLGWRMREIG